jgi:hypothetical protein
MVIAVSSMGMVQVTVHEIIDMIAVRNGGMSAPGAMHVVLGMSAARMFRSAPIRMLGIHLDHMFVHVPAMGMVQMSIVQIIDVVTVLHRCVAAAWAMFVVVVRMNTAGCRVHDFSLHGPRRR